MQDFLAGDLIPTAFNKRERSVKAAIEKKTCRRFAIGFHFIGYFQRAYKARILMTCLERFGVVSSTVLPTMAEFGLPVEVLDQLIQAPWNESFVKTYLDSSDSTSFTTLTRQSTVLKPNKLALSLDRIEPSRRVWGTVLKGSGRRSLDNSQIVPGAPAPEENSQLMGNKPTTMSNQVMVLRICDYSFGLMKQSTEEGWSIPQVLQVCLIVQTICGPLHWGPD
jgi:hypothetical protein